MINVIGKYNCAWNNNTEEIGDRHDIISKDFNSNKMIYHIHMFNWFLRIDFSPSCPTPSISPDSRVISWH